MISVVIPVFRDAVRALNLVHSLLLQELPSDHPLEIVVVDDGSNDGSTELLRQRTNGQFRLVALAHNSGRSMARNAGAENARGEFLAFIDCDCRPEDPYFLASHLGMLRSGCIATCGPVMGDGHGFWSRYQSDASARRARQHAQGSSFAGSTQNCVVQTEAFHRAGGFDNRYKEYGFEDRDLFARLSRLGKLGWCPDAAVRHLDTLALPTVLEKMHRAAGDSAILFARDHAKAYESLGYAALDVRLHAWLRALDLLLNPLLRTAPAINRLILHPRVPYLLVKPIVKFLVAIAYMHGTKVKPEVKTSDHN